MPPRLALAAVAACTIAAQPASAREIELDRREIVLSDIARLDHHTAALGPLVVLRVAEGTPRLELSPERQATLIRRRVPGHEIAAISPEPLRVVFRGAGKAAPAPCLALKQGVAAGDFIHRDLASEVPCRADEPTLPLRFDRVARAPMATEPLPGGTYLGRIALHPGEILAAGTPLTLLVRTGPVTVERVVRPLAPSRAGGRIFVRGDDGTVFAAPFAAAREGTQ